MKPNEKPSWDDAPEWANSLGICNFDVEYKGEWCWCGGTNPSGFICVEERPELAQDPTNPPVADAGAPESVYQGATHPRVADRTRPPK